MPIARTGFVLALTAVLASTALLAAGCGSGGKTTTTTETAADWASGVCTAVTTYETSLKAAATTLTGNLSKDGLQQAAADAKTATDTLTSDLKTLGKPDTTSGQQAKDIVDTLSTQLSADVDTVQNAAASSGLGAISTVTATLTTAQTQIKTAFDQLKALDAKGELSDAFSQATSCASLTG